LKKIRDNDEEILTEVLKDGGKTNHRVRHSYSTPQRAKAIRLANAWGVTKTSRETTIPSPNIKRWLKNGPSRKKGSGRKLMYPELEKRLLRFIRAVRDQNKTITARNLIAKGRMIAKELNFTKIRFSNGWLTRFMKRNNLSRRKKTTSSAHSINDLSASIENFKSKFVAEVLTGDYFDLDQVLNLDETSVKRDAPLNYTIEAKGAKHVAIKTTGSEKTSYTVALCISFTGERLPAMLIWPSQGKKQ
jgi:hypothetical protein